MPAIKMQTRISLNFMQYLKVLLLIVGCTFVDGDGFDCSIQIHSPLSGQVYAENNLTSEVTVEFGQGVISSKVRQNLDQFRFCIEWDVWSVQTQQMTCHTLDESTIAFPTFKGKEGVHRFRASLRMFDDSYNASILVTSEEVSFLSRPVEVLLSNNHQPNNNNKRDGEPCQHSSSFPAIVPWTLVHGEGSQAPLALSGARLDVPLDIEGLSSWPSIEEQLHPQFLALCRSNSRDMKAKDDNSTARNWIESSWEPEECATDLIRQCKAWFYARCFDDGELSSPVHVVASASKGGLDTETLDCQAKDDDIIVDNIDGTDGCSSIRHEFFSSQQHRAPVYVIGAVTRNQFVKRQRDYVFRDLLGCVNNVHVCIDDHDLDGDDLTTYVFEECESILGYANRMKTQHTDKQDMFNWECGSCGHLPSLMKQDSFSVLIASFNGLDEEKLGFTIQDSYQFTNESLCVNIRNCNHTSNLSGSNHVDFLLKREWAPQIIIHLNDEVPSSLPALHHLYEGCHLILRMYGHRGTPLFPTTNDMLPSANFQVHNPLIASIDLPKDRLFRIGTCLVVNIPIGYLAGMADEILPEQGIRIARSGTQAIRANTPSSSTSVMSRQYKWSFVGNRCSHHPHVADSRSSMGAWLPFHNFKCHFTERDGYKTKIRHLPLFSHKHSS